MGAPVGPGQPPIDLAQVHNDNQALHAIADEEDEVVEGELAAGAAAAGNGCWDSVTNWCGHAVDWIVAHAPQGKWAKVLTIIGVVAVSLLALSLFAPNFAGALTYSIISVAATLAIAHTLHNAWHDQPLLS